MKHDEGFTNLNQLFRGRANKKRWPKAAALTHEATSVESRRVDLEHAEKSIELMGRFVPLSVGDPVVVTNQQLHIARALVYHAVMNYARATDPKDSRAIIRLKNALNTEQVRMHQAILAVRNKVVAHHDDDYTHDSDPWIAEIIIAKADKVKLETAYRGQRSYRVLIINYMMDLIPLHLLNLRTIKEEVFQKLHGELDNCFADPIFREAARANAFDEVQFFGEAITLADPAAPKFDAIAAARIDPKTGRKIGQ